MKSSANSYGIFPLTPVQIVVLTYILGALAGGALLSLPISTYGGISFIDALFTATSAVCVTGLIVLDTGSHFTLTGQIIIMTLFQLGGIGIMTLGVLFMSVLAGKTNVFDRSVIRQSFADFGVSNFRKLLLEIVIFTLTVEIAGALLLYYLISGDGLFTAVFHSVSAFCNAGFCLYPNSFIDFRNDIPVNAVLSLLIIVGGIGFIVVRDLRHYVLGRKRRLSLHTKVVLTVSAVLLVGGALMILALEWDNAFHGNTLREKILVSMFQSVTSRTAGFNTVELAHFSGASLLVIIFLMFIGASPGSCGGGIKTTTFAVLLSYVKHRAMGTKESILYKRTIPSDIVSKTFAVVTASVLLLFLAAILIASAEGWGLAFDKNPAHLTKSLFEAVSAFGTVGLSLGLTEELSSYGKFLVILTMLAGRVGPLALAIAIGGRKQKKIKYAEEQVMVG